MVTKMNYVKGNFATTHQHPHEQCGYVISGEYRLNVEMEQPIDVVLHAGDSYAIPGNTPHSFEVLEAPSANCSANQSLLPPLRGLVSITNTFFVSNCSSIV
jgi:quercetin dioxygenase-like cupin family protein